MHASPLSLFITALGDQVRNLEPVISRIKKSTGAVVACFSCDFLPFEILSAFNIYPYVQPRHLYESSALGVSLPASVDVYVKPETCCRSFNINWTGKTLSIPSFPAEYGEASLAQWKTILDDVIHNITGVTNYKPDQEILAAHVEKFNTIRRMVRGIASLRVATPSLLTNADLRLIFDAALCLPFDILYGQLEKILDALNSMADSSSAKGIPSMVYGRCAENPALLDMLETTGFTVVEDDTCCGRRSFDLSHNSSSHDLYHEILNAFSFRPFCPCLRSAASRFELLYRLAGSYGIETVILVEDDSCPARTSQIDELRVRLMRAGMDPLVVTPEGAENAAKRYIELASL